MWRTEGLQGNVSGTAPAVPLLPHDGKPRRAALARNSFVPVRSENALYYGGDQSWMRDHGGLYGAYISKTGCGAAAVVNAGWYLSGGGELDRAGFLTQMQETLRYFKTPVLRAQRLGFETARYVRRISSRQVRVRILQNRSTSLPDALNAVADSLTRDKPAAMQVLRSRYGKADGAERVIPWHWTVLTALTFDPSQPETAVCVYSTWGERRTFRFANAWEDKKGLFKRASLVLFDF